MNESIDGYAQKYLLQMQGDPAHEDIKTGLLLLGGGMRGAAGAGIVQVLVELENHLLRSLYLEEHPRGQYPEDRARLVDYAFGVSAGAETLLGLSQSLETATHLSDTYEQLVGHFRNFRRHPHADVDHLAGIFEKHIDVDRLQSHPTESYVYVLRDYDDGSHGYGFINLKDADDPLNAAKASAAIPILYRTPVFIDDRHGQPARRARDPSLTHPVPKNELFMTAPDMTNLLVGANINADQLDGLRPRWRDRGVPLLGQAALALSGVRSRELPSATVATGLDNLEQLAASYGVTMQTIMSPHSVKSLSEDRDAIRQLRLDTYTGTRDLFIASLRENDAPNAALPLNWPKS